MDNVLVSFGGDELELRKISAGQYLAAGADAEELFKEYGRNDVAMAIIMGAALLSQGLHNGDGRAYGSVRDVLDSVTAEEIIETAQYIELDEDTKIGVIEAAEKVRRKVTADNRETVDEADQNRRMEAIGVIEDVTDVKQTGETVTRGENSRSELPEIRSRSRADSRDFYTMYSSTAPGTSPIAYKSGLSPRDDMRRVSDFFQRDSRRYDGAITSY